ncbi:MAG: hypothetical protein HYZ44_16985 [Bacteroidetes bacterium]|nr:hypothetical protein [Bacteroidota bacterium]
MLSRYFISTLFIIVTGITNTYSQSNYITGSVITNQGDTLRGYINNRGWDVSPKSIEFKKERNAREQIFSVDDIVGFEINSVRYVAVEVDIEISPYLIDKMDTIAVFSTTRAKVFLKQLVAGTKSLYKYAEKNDHPFFYISNNGQFELLKHKRYFRYQLVTTHGYSAKKVILENKAYLAQVVRYLNDCMEVNRYLQYTRYDQKSLLQLFELYYKCHNTEKVVILNKSDNYKFEMGPVLYMARPTLSFSGANFAGNYPVRSSFSTSPLLSIGFSGDFVFKNANRKFTLGNELIYNSLKSTGYYSVFVTNDDYDKYTTQVDISIIRLNTIFRLSKSVGQVDVSVLAGLLANFLIDQKSIKRPNNATPTITTKRVDLFSSSVNTGIISGVGLGFKRYRLDARYELGLAMNGPSELRDLGTTGQINSLALVLSYKW